jgi:hypothetical protein
MFPKLDQTPSTYSVAEYVDLGNGIDKLIRSYDESAAAVSQFEDRAGRIFQLMSKEKEHSWLDCCFVGMLVLIVMNCYRRNTDF